MSPLGELARRRRGDPLPSTPAAVLLVAVGGAPTAATVKRAVADAGDGTVAVMTLLRIHGSAWGFPHPGLMPNAREKDDARRIVATTIAAVERRGGHADGQVTATRHPAKVIAAAARRRGCGLVLVERPGAGRLRGAIEGDVAVSVRRRLRTDATVTVEGVERPVRPDARPTTGRAR